jgi:hypothetical protein
MASNEPISNAPFRTSSPTKIPLRALAQAYDFGPGNFDRRGAPVATFDAITYKLGLPLSFLNIGLHPLLEFGIVLKPVGEPGQHRFGLLFGSMGVAQPFQQSFFSSGHLGLLVQF